MFARGRLYLWKMCILTLVGERFGEREYLKQKRKGKREREKAEKKAEKNPLFFLVSYFPAISRLWCSGDKKSYKFWVDSHLQIPIFFFAHFESPLLKFLASHYCSASKQLHALAI